MKPGASPRPAGSRRRPGGPSMLIIVPVLAILLGVGLAAVAVANRPAGGPVARWQAAPVADATGAPGTGPSTLTAPADPAGTATDRTESAEAEVITLSATGDIVLGNAPGRLPPAGGKGFFDPVRPALQADLVMGNLEQPLTEDTGHAKCGPAPAAAPAGSSAAPARKPAAPKSSGNCHQFRAPPEYAGHLRDAGFRLLNQANNHGNDYGAAGYRNTQQALERHGLQHTGAPGQVTVVDVKGVRVAVVGFSSYPWNNNLVNIGAAKKLITQAAERADLVVVQVHMGGEGEDKTHVKRGTEMFLGENRGDPIGFSHAVIDAGADLVVGHGPHVLRGMEFHRGRLIAYSLGNFAGGAGALSSSGRKGLGGVLKVSLTRTGDWRGGQFLSTYFTGSGKPQPDDRQRGRALVAELSTADFGASAARFGADGAITPPG